MDFNNAYRSIENTYMEGEWWLIKKAYDKDGIEISWPVRKIYYGKGSEPSTKY